MLDALLAKFPDQLTAPSVSLFGGANLYLRGVLEEETKVNLPRRMAELMGGSTGAGGDGARGEGMGDAGDMDGAGGVGRDSGDGDANGGVDAGKGDNGGGGAAEVDMAAGVTEGTIIVNDKKLHGPLRVKLVLK